MRVFIGSDPRAPIALNVAAFSVARRASKPVSITPLILDQLPIARRGLTEFTFSRFLVAYLCQFQGWALWMDSDIVCNTDVTRMMEFANDEFSVLAVDTKEAYERAAVMLFNCGHPDNAVLTPDFIERASDLHTLGWTANAGKLPKEFNFCVDYDELPPQLDNGQPPQLPAMIHYTKGIPVWPETEKLPFADVWHRERRAMCGVVPNWSDLMGASRHEIG